MPGFVIILQNRGKPTGLEPATSSRATIRQYLFPGVAVRCTIGLSKPISLLVLAQRFCVLRSEWCQMWCQMALAAPPIPKGLIAPRSTRLRTALRVIGEAAQATRIQEPHAVDRLDPARAELLGGPPARYPLAVAAELAQAFSTHCCRLHA